MEFETARASHIGDRAENQDRSEILVADESAFAILADGMGGHARGSLAAGTAIASLAARFRRTHGRIRDPEAFLNDSLSEAHEEVLALGEGAPLSIKPGTIIVCVLVSGTAMWWAHVGDSRAYHFRAGKLLARTRDHTGVEALLETGKITAAEATRHRNRHIVEYCLGVNPELPPTTISTPIAIEAGDVVLLCSDGLWGQLDETTLTSVLSESGDLEQSLRDLIRLAVETGRPHSDNVTAVAFRIFADNQENP